jgi:hypothetical protein
MLEDDGPVAVERDLAERALPSKLPMQSARKHARFLVAIRTSFGLAMLPMG